LPRASNAIEPAKESEVMNKQEKRKAKREEIIEKEKTTMLAMKKECDLEFKCMLGYMNIIPFLAEVMHDGKRLGKKEGELIIKSLAALRRYARTEVEMLAHTFSLDVSEPCDIPSTIKPK